MTNDTTSNINYQALAKKIKFWGKELGFEQVGICDVDLSSHEPALIKWLENNLVCYSNNI